MNLNVQKNVELIEIIIYSNVMCRVSEKCDRTLLNASFNFCKDDIKLFIWAADTFSMCTTLN